VGVGVWALVGAAAWVSEFGTSSVGPAISLPCKHAHSPSLPPLAYPLPPLAPPHTLLQWRYSDFVNAVEDGKVERVRFSKDGSQLQLTAVDGRRATVVLPNDPELVDTLAKNGVDISVRARLCAGAPWGVGG